MRKSLKFILLFLFAVFILWFFGRNLDWAEIRKNLSQANGYYLSAATLIICLGYLFRAFRWRTLLAPITETSLRELFAATVVGFSVIFIVGRAGEIVRPMWLSMRDHRVRPSAGLITLVIERVCDTAALICFFAASLLWLKPPAEYEREFANVRFIGMLMLVGVVFGIAALYFYYKYSAAIIGWFEKLIDKKIIPKKIQAIFLNLLEQMATSLEIFRNWREVAAVVGWTIVVWLGIAVPTWLIILAFDIPFGFADSLFVMFVAAIGSLVPTPGGAAGAFHAATAGGLILFGVDKEKAWAISFAMHIIYFAPAIFFGFYYFLRGDISLARLRGLLSSDHTVEDVEHETEFQVQSPESGVQSRESQIEIQPSN
ncbi:MAG: lysylphosphatidylglycerol synthase transmembrane domain-containing protein [Pyrinomonadaceae bacterium]